MTPLILLLAAQCSCAGVDPTGPVVLMTEAQCAAELAPVTRALEGCNAVLDLVSTATAAIVAMPPPPPPAPDPMPRVLGGIMGAGVGAGVGVAFASTEGVPPVAVGLSAVGGALALGAIGALIGWVVE
jgi:hypothetical protein